MDSRKGQDLPSLEETGLLLLHLKKKANQVAPVNSFPFPESKINTLTQPFNNLTEVEKLLTPNPNMSKYIFEPFQRVRYLPKHSNVFAPIPEHKKLFLGNSDVRSTLFPSESSNKRFPCAYPGCNKMFPALSRMRRHLDTHFKLKPYQCEFKGCKKFFSRKDNMRHHMKRHFSENPK